MNKEERYKIKELLIEELIEEGIIPESSKNKLLIKKEAVKANRKKLTASLLKRIINEVIKEETSK